MNQTTLGYAYVLAAATQWGMIGPFARLAFDQGLTPLEVAFWRAAVGGVLFSLHALVIGQYRVQCRDMPIFALFGLVCVGVFYGSYQKTVDLGGASMAAVLLYTAPAWVALLAWLFLKEQLGWMKLLALAMTLVGVFGVSLGPDGLAALRQGAWNLKALGFGLLSGFTYALYYLFGKKFLGRYTAATLMVYALPIGALALFPWVDFQPKGLTAWAALGVLGLVTTYGAFLAYCAGLRRLEATRASVVATFEPVVAASVAFVWWDERMGALGLLGAALIIGAVLVMVRIGSGNGQP
ncbi:MAG TPA: EamA/RhaT family transporter [Desulfonatronum sp.]|mgnify:CR=1 FL=1|nr:EamA/RhaT family transporter [Desulfonatronum sp.]